MLNNETQFEDRLKRLDLDPILFRLVVAEDGPQWSLNFAREVETWYRRYHILFHLHPSEVIVPTKEVDEFWHFHILDTKKYYEDCVLLHGRMVHHFPYLGLRGNEDQLLLKELSQRTLNLCTAYFNGSPTELQNNNNTMQVCGGSCGHGRDPRITSDRPSVAMISERMAIYN
jgi:hypothetical protein